MENVGTKSLENKVCLITGAARGIGRAITEKLAARGGIVYANDRLVEEMGEWVKECADKYATEIIPVSCDICDFQAVKQMINNAGIVTYEYLGMIDFEKLRQMFEVNVIAMIHLIQLVSRLMTRQKSGSIINMASIVGVKGAKGQLAYSATKGAVVSVTRSAAKELAEHQIRVNAVAPGMVATDRFLHSIENRFEDRLNSVGFGRYALPEDIADAISFFASDESKYITGQVLGVDGGFIL